MARARSWLTTSWVEGPTAIHSLINLLDLLSTNSFSESPSMDERTRFPLEYDLLGSLPTKDPKYLQFKSEQKIDFPGK